MTPDPADSPRPRKRRLWRWLLLAVGLLVLFPIGVIYSLNWYGEHRFQAELDKIRARGEPVDAEGMERRYVATEPNLTDEWAEALTVFNPRIESTEPCEMVAGIPILDKTLLAPLPGELWSERHRAEAALEKVRKALVRLQDLSLRDGGVRYPIRFADGDSMLVEHLPQLRDAARHLVLQAHLQAHDDAAHDAAASLCVVFAASRTLEREPVLVSVFTRTELDQIATACIRSFLGIVPLSTEDLVRLQHDLRRATYLAEMRETLLGERVMVLSQHYNAVDGFGGDKSLTWRLTRGRDIACYFDIVAGLLDSTILPSQELISHVNSIDMHLRGLENDPSSAMKYRITTLFAGLLVRGFQGIYVATARNRAADAAIDAELYRRKHGELPEKVEQLVPEFLPEVPLDPFDGQPIRYVVREDKYVFYSVGPNGQDDGAPGPPADDPHGDGPDIEFAVKRKAK